MIKKIHPLIKAARDKKISHPGQLDKFDQQHWIAYAKSIGTEDQEAVAFFTGAIWLNGHFHRVKNTREQFTWSGSTPPDYRELVCAHIAGANYAFWEVMAEQEKFIAGLESPAAEQLVASKSSMVGDSDPIGVNQVIMHRLDSLRGPLWELFHFKDQMAALFPGDRPNKLSLINLFMVEMRMSQYYHNFSQLWQELLYGHGRFHYQQGEVFFIHRHADYHRIKCIAEYRREHNQVTGMQQTCAVLKQMPIIPKWPGYLSYNINGSLTITSWDNLSENVQLIAQFHTLAPFSQLDDHLKPLLKQTIATSVERTLQTCIDLWVHFAVLSEQINASLKTNSGINEWKDLLALAPQFDRTNLLSLLCQCTGYIESEIEKAFKILTWLGEKPQEDLWAQPLVRIDGKILFPISAFLTGQISRNVDCWMNKLDNKDTHRGKMFERDLMRLFENCRTVNTVMGEHLHYTPAIKPCYGGIQEEIDATFSFGNLLVIVEARSRKVPITPLDYENELYDKNGLIKKSMQAARKADFVRYHIKDFCQDYYPQLLEKNNIKVLPLVIVNGSFHAGYPFNNVPVVDTSLLLHFLKDGEIRFMYNQIEEKYQYGLPLWNTIEEAQACFEEYLRKPVLIDIYELFCKETEIRSKNLGESYEDIVTLTFEMQVEQWEQYIGAVELRYPGRLIKYF
ncbi:hypothetical protein [Leminorella grimontii]|uniref:hypothetical protein n=1 Tax=Leminorella grimontii TaxID=82981 RepID=UPI0032209779